MGYTFFRLGSIIFITEILLRAFGMLYQQRKGRRKYGEPGDSAEKRRYGCNKKLDSPQQAGMAYAVCACLSDSILPASSEAGAGEDSTFRL